MEEGRHFSLINRRTIPGFLVFFLVICLGGFTSPAAAQNPAPGLAGGFEIDGNVLANNPGGIVALGDDWVDGPAGPGIGVLFPGLLGMPKNPTMTVHIRDLTKNDDADVFGESNKVFDDPNGYTWKAGSVPQKDDIQNGLVDFSIDENGAPWIKVAGDRRSVNGDSYIDFEFLQNSLTMNGDGTFTAGGPHRGRTLGDVLLTIKLTKGGSQALFSVQRWESDGQGGFTYNDIPIPPGAAFVAANIDSQVTSSYEAFGGTAYDVNQFGEGAVNLEALLSSVNDCVAFATLFIRTKSSASADAELKDFIEPIEVNVCIDETAPELIVPGDITISCEQSLEPLMTGAATATDDCTQDVTLSHEDVTISSDCETGTIIHRTWTATDNCGNTSSETQVITVVDKTPPDILSGPGPVTVECGSAVPPPDTGAIVAADACGGVTVTHVGDASSGTDCDRVITRTYRATDDCGNSTDFVQVITIRDTTPPAATASPAFSVQCAAQVPDPDTGTVTAGDNCGAVTVVWLSDDSDGNSCPEVITRTYRVTDACGNSTDVSQRITVHDTVAPEVTGPSPLTVACVGDVPAPDTGLISGTDNCGNVTVSYVGQESDGSSCPEVITRTYRVADNCGNATDFYHTITVNDTIPPTVSGPEDVTLQCIDELPVADTGLIEASDNCGAVTVVHVGDSSNNNTCDEIVTRTYRVTDSCNNSVDYVQLFRISDTREPEISCPQDIVVQNAADVPAASVEAVSARDNCGTVSVTHVGDFSDGKSCPETIRRVYRATDPCGNYTECTQTIVVDDNTPPVVTGGPADVTVECFTEIPPASLDSLVADDNSGTSAWTHVGDESNGESCPTVITRTYRVSDPCGNSADYVQTITVHDKTPPVLSECAANKRLECPDNIVFTPPAATDNCDPDPAVYEVNSETTVEPWKFIMKRSWAAEDACGNVSAECRQTITAECEADGFCTFTQGFWGNYGGYFNGESTIEIITRLLEEPLVVGKDGRSIRIEQNAADCIVTRLPGGTTPTVLPDIGNANLHHSRCQVPQDALPLNSEGRIENVLLTQTIALSLNTRYNFWLLTFPLSLRFYTVDALPGPDGLYGTGDDIADPNADVLAWYIPEAVLKALANLDQPVVVYGLLELANRALAGWDTGGATLSEINMAVDTINNAFNGCRLIADPPAISGLGKDTSRLTLTTDSSPVEPSPGDTEVIREFKLEQNYPNPFNPTTRIQIAVPQAEQWTLAIYNVAGQLVRRFDGATGGPERVTVTWDGRDASGAPVASGVYLYRIQAGWFVDVKRMVLLK